jgi:hypothetical protein
MSDTELAKWESKLAQWWAPKSWLLIRWMLGATGAIIGSLIGCTWWLSATLHDVNLAVERNGNADAIMRSELGRLESRIGVIELRLSKP